ncbi:hypothetical protein ABPG73_017035 [Tetrahymena malaccensis]
MDKTTLKTLKCHKHQKKDLQFIQVNDVLNQQSQNKELFYCSSCFNHDLEFKSINYLMIDQILQEAENSIIPKWPPVNNYQIIQDLIDLTSNESELNYEKQITNFFDQFKEQILEKIDIIQKKMINETLKYPIYNHQIIQKYQEISNILQFKQLLINEQAKNLSDHSSICRQFIQQMESQKDQNTELLQSLLKQSNQLQKSFDLEYPNIIKQELLALIDQISFFNQEISQGRENHNNPTIYQSDGNFQNSNKITSDLIMKLVSNKSNFCADQFINKLNMTLQKLNPLLQQSTFDSIFQENKEPIEFEKLNEDKLNLINFQNFIQDKEKFGSFKNCEDQILKDFMTIYEKGLFYFDQNMFGTSHQGGLKDLVVSRKRNGEDIIFKKNSASWNCCISSLDLKKDLKYICRIQIENIDEGNEFLIGLMRNNTSKNRGG